MCKLLKKQGFTPKLLVTDKLRSYASAIGCPYQREFASAHAQLTNAAAHWRNRTRSNHIRRG